MGLPLALPSHQIPLGLKLAYTVFVAVLVPIYWDKYTPLNFLYFCDVALLLTVPALWLESSLLASMMAVGITLPQLIWQVDFISFLLFRTHFPLDFTSYMFNPEKPLYLRGLSFFHFWLPILLLWMVWRLGYDRRALLSQIALTALILLLSYLFTARIDGLAGNVNKVFGMDEKVPQSSMHRLLWLGILLVVWSGVYLATHLLFCGVMPRRREIN